MIYFEAIGQRQILRKTGVYNQLLKYQNYASEITVRLVLFICGKLNRMRLKLMQKDIRYALCVKPIDNWLPSLHFYDS